MSKQSNINFIIKMDIYPFDIMISIAQTDSQLGRLLDKYHLSVEDILLCKYTNDNCQGRAATFATNNASIIRLRHLPETPEDHGTLAHEVFHVASFIMQMVGVKLEIMVSDEAYAYLIGFITKSIYKEINQYY